MFNEAFKKLRKEQNISLTQAAKGATSVSTLSRWENGHGDIGIETFINLLENIHIAPEEFFSITVTLSKMSFIASLQPAYESNNYREFKKTGEKWLKTYHSSHDPEDLFKAATCYQTYADITSKNIFPKDDAKKLAEIFSNVTYWSYHYITTFGNCVSLLPSKKVFGITMIIINDIAEIKKGGFEHFIDTIGSLLNAVYFLITTDPNKAALLLNRLEDIHLSIYALHLSIKRKFLNKLLKYRINGDKTPILKYLSAIKELDIPRIYDLYKEMFNQIKALNKA